MRDKRISGLCQVGVIACMILGGNLIGHYAKVHKDTNILWILVPLVVGASLAYIHGIYESK